MAEERQTALITGTSRGIGLHLARHFLSKGWRVFGCSRAPAAETHTDYTHFQADVTDESRVKAMIRAIGRETGRLDVLVNNAGTASMNLALTTPRETAVRLLETNVLGTFLVSREAAKLMLRRRFGRIVSLGSTAVPMRIPGESVYSASKSAVTALTQILSRELAPYGITCNIVAPGPIATDLIAGLPPEKVNEIVEAQAIKRLGTPEDVAHVIDFFIDPGSDFITGQILYLGGV